MAFWDKEELIITVEKNKSENIDIKHCKKNDKKYIDVRISRVNKENVYTPTSSGVAIPEDKWQEISQAINSFIESTPK